MIFSLPNLLKTKDTKGNLLSAKTARRIGSKGEKGQSLVEFSLMVVILTSLLLGILDIGRAYFTFMALQDAAGEGASYAAQYPTYITSSNSADPNNVTYRVKNAAPVGTLVDWSSATVSVANSGSTAQGEPITVTVTTSYQLLTPFVGTIVGSQTLPLSAESVATITAP
jgi:Flp pilus assembly protein TadG